MQGGARTRTAAYKLVCEDARPKRQRSRWTFYEAVAFSPESRYITAILTATPFVTCSSITVDLSSDSSGDISTPQFTGPGCITIASSFANLNLSFVRQYCIEYSLMSGK